MRISSVLTYSVLEFFYEVIYFYFSPFLVLILVISFGSDPNDAIKMKEFQKHEYFYQNNTFI